MLFFHWLFYYNREDIGKHKYAIYLLVSRRDRISQAGRKMSANRLRKKTQIKQ